MRPVYIHGARIVDPASGRDDVGNLLIRGANLVSLPASPPPDAEMIDAKGLVAAPGFIDLHVHLREPGGEEAETVETGCRAAARGGFTAVVAMPNTKPPTDRPEQVAWLKRRGEELALARVIPSACISAGRKGDDLADMPRLLEAGALAFTDDGAAVKSAALMLKAMQAAGEFGALIMEHAQDPDLEGDGVMHQGDFSAKAGLPGIPAEAELSIVRRDIELAERTGCRLHFQHLSTTEAANLVRKAKKRGLRVSAELTPHHLTLTDADVNPEDANFKMNPPLRSCQDRAGLIAAVVDGTIEAFATDHAPHAARAKGLGFRDAPFGIVGLETAVGITCTEMVQTGLMDVATWVRRWTLGPAHILGLPPPSLRPGAPADLVLLDLSTEWTVKPEDFLSRSRNTPFAGRRLVGRAVRTFHRGRTTWAAPR